MVFGDKKFERRASCGIYRNKRMRWNPRPPAAAFTLIEMLAVVGILSIVLALAVPAFQNLGKANSLSSAGNTTANLISAARQNSVSRNVLTAFVVLTGTGTEADYRTFGLFERGVSGGWQQIGAWETLPQGIFVDAADKINCSFLDNSPLRPTLNDANDATAIYYLGRPIDSSNLAFRVFVPTGAISNPERAAQLRLVEGTLEGSASNYSVRTRRDGGVAVNYYDVAIIGTTGAPKISRP